MKYYPCNGKRCPIQYNAISSVENCKLFDKCNFYEPRKTPEYESLMKLLKDELKKDGETKVDADIGGKSITYFTQTLTEKKQKFSEFCRKFEADGERRTE